MQASRFKMFCRGLSVCRCRVFPVAATSRHNRLSEAPSQTGNEVKTRYIWRFAGDPLGRPLSSGRCNAFALWRRPTSDRLLGDGRIGAHRVLVPGQYVMRWSASTPTRSNASKVVRRTGHSARRQSPSLLSRSPCPGRKRRCRWPRDGGR